MQAKNVAVWTKYSDHCKEKYNKKCILSNSNKIPMFNVIVIFSLNSDSDMDPLSNKNIDDQAKYYETLPPGKEIFEYYPWNSAGQAHLLPMLYFTDANNRKWIRFKNGYLKECKYDYVKKGTEAGMILHHV